MKNTIINLLVFTVGAAIGSAVTYKLVKIKCEQKADAEIESMKRYYEGQDNVEKFEPKKFEPKKFEYSKFELTQNDPEPSAKERVEYSNIIKESGYSSEKGGPVDVGVKPYVISPDEFSEIEHYQTMTLFYYSDGILADEEQEVIEDIDGCIGIESLKHFGEYADDAVYVRNDRQRIDYEILLDERKFYPERPDIREEE